MEKQSQSELTDVEKQYVNAKLHQMESFLNFIDEAKRGGADKKSIQSSFENVIDIFFDLTSIDHDQNAPRAKFILLKNLRNEVSAQVFASRPKQ